MSHARTRATVGALIALLLAVWAALGAGTEAADASSSVRFSSGRFDSIGSDKGSNSSLNGEWITIKNYGSKAVALKGWKVKDAANHTYTFGSFTLKAGKSVTLYTGKGTNSSTKRYWGQSWYIWNNTGDTAYLKNASGSTVDTCKGKGLTVTC
jgi:hypothetical protein